MAVSEGFLVPRTYAELQRLYGPHIKKLLMRYNRVERNFEDLHSYVWMKIMEARVLDRFDQHMARQNPRVLSALEVCDFLGVSLEQWSQAQRQYWTGRSVSWMPRPVNEPVFQLQGLNWFDSTDASYAYGDVIRLTWGEEIQGRVYWPFKKWGQEVRDGVVVGKTRPEGHLKIPPVRPTASQFRNYLSTSVLNHYANFCRTLKRRHKERPQTPRGFDGDPVPWEDTLEEVKQTPAELTVAVNEAHTLLSATLQSCFTEAEIPEGRVVENRIWGQLQEGATLLQALKRVGLPVRVRRSVLQSVRRDFGYDPALDETPD